MAKHPTNFVVIGLGNFGSTVATELKRFGNYVIGIDTDEGRVSSHADMLDQALIVDARSDAALRDAGAEECEVGVVALENDFEASVLAAMNLRLVGVGKIWAMAVSKTHHRILNHIGVERVIRSDVRMGEQVAQMLHNPLIRDYVSLGNTYHVVNLRVPEELNGSSLDDLDFAKFELRCLGVMRGTDFVGREGDSCELEGDEMLILLGRRRDLRDFSQSL